MAIWPYKSRTMPEKLNEEAATLLQRREAGILPKIDILGTAFVVDWRLRELREYGAPWNIIDLRELECNETGAAYLLFYDREEKVGYHTDETIYSPDNIVLLEIPHEIKLDPYALALEHDMDVLQFLSAHPIDPRLKANLHSVRKNQYSQTAGEEMESNNINGNSIEASKPERRRGR